MPSKNSDIIRMEPEDIEKAGVCGVDERSSRDGDPGRKSGNLEKRGCGKNMEEQAKPPRTTGMWPHPGQAGISATRRSSMEIVRGAYH